MVERTEEDKVVQAGIKVILGGVEYSIPPLVIRDSREWRRKVIALIAPLPELTPKSIDTTEDFENALTTLLVTMSDRVVDLFFEYAKELNQEEIEAVATDAELSQAFREVIEVAFPLAQNAPDMVTRLYSTKTTKKSSR